MFTCQALLAQRLHGRILDKDLNSPLGYASFGIKNVDKGGIADSNGRFSIDISNLNASDSIIFSHIGYMTTSFPIREMDLSKDLLIKLSRKPQEFQQVFVAAKQKALILGNQHSSGRFTGWGDDSSSRGRAVGIQISPLAFPVRATDFTCFVKYNTFDSVKIRLNILRKLPNNAGLEQLLADNIYFTIPKHAKRFHVDLSHYNIIVKDTIVLAMEWIDAWAPPKKPGSESNLFTIGLSNIGGYSYLRNTPDEMVRLTKTLEMPTMYLKGYRTANNK